MEKIAYIKTNFPEKFGVPRQSGLCNTIGVIEFTPKYRSKEAIRGLEGFSHIWLLWEFSENENKPWSPTVRPPRLGGNKRMGVFATRSPYRPNPIGLSAVKLIKIETDGNNTPRLIVSGADLVDGTPIYDIKPYLPISDCIPDAKGGFSDEKADYHLKVVLPEDFNLPFKEELTEILSGDPRPSYHEDGRSYTMSYSDYEITFTVADETLTVINIKKR